MTDPIQPPVSRRTSLNLPAAEIDRAKELGLNISAICSQALSSAVGAAARARWIEENREVLESQADWLEQNELPWAEAMVGPARESWMAHNAEVRDAKA